MTNNLLTIGIDKYLKQKNLNCCVKDCKDIMEILNEKYNFSIEHCSELHNEDATNLKIQQKFKEYIKSIKEEDNLIIYFSGHGGFDKTTEKGYWIPYDSDPENFTTWISNEIILSYLKQINAKHIFLISDSCFSRSILITESTKSILSDAKDYDLSKSRWALTSGAEECLDGEIGSNSLFCEVILNILRLNTGDLRVGTIIDKVKEKFNVNLFQKPQGYPLNISSEGGEFIFKISSDAYVEDIQVKGYKDFLTLLELYKRNGMFKETSIYENKSTRVGFQIYQMHDRVVKNENYFLLLYEGINQQKTYDYLKKYYPQIFNEGSLIIIIPKEKKKEIANPEKRKQNIFEKFHPLNIFYVDEFIREECNPKRLNNEPSEKYLELNNFIIPSFSYNNNLVETEDFFEEWINKENEPILVLKGEGGIGKTTFAKFIADQFLKINSLSTVLFMDSSEVRKKLFNQEKNYENISLYNFYEAFSNYSGYSKGEKLSEDLFRINLDAGNFLIIIDGLDEVISKDPRFNVDEFLNSIVSYSSDIGNGKTIITCRSYFWETSNYSSKEIKAVDILPFNDRQTKKFFEKSFKSDKKKVRKSQKLAEEFKFQNENNEIFFHPYVLDVIRSIVESNQEILNFDLTFQSNILEKTVKNDYIIYRICLRETIRVEQINVDEQIEFFLYWSTKRRGIINLENFDREICDALGKHIDKTNVEAFKSHPFIQVSNKNVRFKYDFFADYFKCVYVSRYLKLENNNQNVNEDFLKILSENCWYGSSMISDIKKRIVIWSDDEILKCSDLMNQILENKSLNMFEKRKCLSALFNICIAVNIKFKTNNIEQNTLLIKSIFGKTMNEIYGLHIINVHSNEDFIRFDFCNLNLIECYIDSYNGFWNCQFNENTYFIDSYLLNLEYGSDKKIPIKQGNFRNCITDQKFKAAFKMEELNINNSVQQIREFLTSFFSLFYKRGMLVGQTIDKPHKGREHHPPLIRLFASISNQVLSFEEIIDFMKQENMLEYFNYYAEKKVKIIDSQKNDVIKFIKDGTMSKKIISLINIINEYKRS